MCGITGALWTDPALAIEPETLDRMTESLRHRGPDDCGTHRAAILENPPYTALPGVALGFRRLSIIDLAGGHQPLPNEDETVWVIFNGEVYNFPELRHRLEGAGHRFRSRSDTETIVHLYEDEGLDCFRHLNGMFSIAIWDSRKGRLVLARDRLGQKPLFYSRQRTAHGHRFLFGSELKSILEVPGVERSLDPNALDEYLTYQYVPDPNTIYQGIKKLPPGHRAVVSESGLSVERYWEPPFQTEWQGSRAEAVERLRELMDSSVRLRMQSDVPLGAFLSGGVDSSLVVALMQRHSTERIKTFTIGFPVKAYDESHFAQQVADHLGTEHHCFQVTPDAVGILEKLVWHYDEPFADSSAVPTWYVSEQTRQHVTVALSGDGGDELFAGYPRYRAIALAARLDRLGPVKSLLAADVWKHLPGGGRQKSIMRRFKRFHEALRADPVRRYLDWISIFNEQRRGELYEDAFLERLRDSDPVQFLKSAWRRSAGRDPLTMASLGDLLTYLPCDLMTKVDIASMAHSLECRQPFLDYRLVEFAAGLPIGWKYRRGQGKRILREAFGELLPEAIWKRPKMGFGVPLDHWFRHDLQPLVRDVLLDADARSAPLFRRETLARLVEQHTSGAFDHSYRLWALLFLELWMREWKVSC